MKVEALHDAIRICAARQRQDGSHENNLKLRQKLWTNLKQIGIESLKIYNMMTHDTFLHSNDLTFKLCIIIDCIKTLNKKKNALKTALDLNDKLIRIIFMKRQMLSFKSHVFIPEPRAVRLCHPENGFFPAILDQFWLPAPNLSLSPPGAAWAPPCQCRHVSSG